MSAFPLSEDTQGNVKPGLAEPRHFAQTWQRGSTTADVVGDGVANGTLILSVAIAAGHTLIVFGAVLTSKAGAKKILMVESNLATVGGVETVHQDIDLPATGMAVLGPYNSPIAVITNTSAGLRYFNIYMPQARAGVATNNAAGQFCTASIMAIMD